MKRVENDMRHIILYLMQYIQNEKRTPFLAGKMLDRMKTIRVSHGNQVEEKKERRT